MVRYGAFAYSESAVWLGYSSQHDDPEGAKREALENCGKDDAVILCCESDCWLAFALSDSTEGYWWATGEDGPTAAANAVAGLREAGGASDVRLIVCYSVNDGEEYMPAPPPPPPQAGTPPAAPPPGRGWETAKKVADVAGTFVRAIIKGD